MKWKRTVGLLLGPTGFLDVCIGGFGQFGTIRVQRVATTNDDQNENGNDGKCEFEGRHVFKQSSMNDNATQFSSSP